MKSVADRCKPVAEQIALPPVLADIHPQTLYAGNDPLHQGRRIDEAEDPVAENHAVDRIPNPGQNRIDGDVTDPFARQGKAFGIGRRDDAVRTGLQDAGHPDAVIDDLAVRFVGHEVDRLPQRPALVLQKRRKRPNRAFIIDPARRVVGRIDQNDLGPVRNGGLHSVQIQREIIFRFDRFQDAAGVVGIESVLHEKRRRNQHLVAGIQQGLQDDVQGASGAAGHDDVLGG